MKRPIFENSQSIWKYSCSSIIRILSSVPILVNKEAKKRLQWMHSLKRIESVLMWWLLFLERPTKYFGEVYLEMLWRGPSSLLWRITSKQHQSQAPLVLQRVDVEVHLEFKCLTLLLSRTSIFLSFHFTFHKKMYFDPALESPTSYGMDANINILSCWSELW